MGDFSLLSLESLKAALSKHKFDLCCKENYRSKCGFSDTDGETHSQTHMADRQKGDRDECKAAIIYIT